MKPIVISSILAPPGDAVMPDRTTEARFYLGTYTSNSKSKGIYLGGIDTKTGKLLPLSVAGEATDPSFLALSPDGAFLYAAIEAHDGAVAAFRVEPDGMLVRLNEQPSGDAPCHVWVDATGRNVLAANYFGGSVTCFRTRADGSLGERTALVSFTGSGPDPVRQTKPFAHSIYTDPSNRFAYCCDLGTDSVRIFKFDPDSGSLEPNAPPAGKVPPGGGPRHLVMNGEGTIFYIANEMGHSVTALTRNATTGALAFSQDLSILPQGADPRAFTTGEICSHPSGRWLYVSIRDISGRGNDLFTVCSIARDGSLKVVENVPAQVKIPRGFAIDPTGQWLVAAGEADNRMMVFKIDQATGKLEATDQTAEVPSPVCVVFDRLRH